jgi:hypothetical protein
MLLPLHARILILMSAVAMPAIAVRAEAQALRRACKPRLAWESMGPTKAAARDKAISGWSAAARAKHGDGWDAWTIAGVARIGCILTPDGHRCRAAAAPCRDLVPGGSR